MKNKIISHRGLWKITDNKNTFEALLNANLLGFGFETDVRDFNGKIYVAHDPINGFNKNLLFETLISKLVNKECILAINIKSDSIINSVINILEKYKIQNYFLFDMSIPEFYKNRNKAKKLFIGQSDVFNITTDLKNIGGVWLDSFTNESWITVDVINSIIKNNQKICIVSPELHNRDYESFWLFLIENNIIQNKNIMLCTDKPVEALSFFQKKLNND